MLILWNRVIGWGFVISGALMVVFFPYVTGKTGLQVSEMSNAGVVVGIILIGIGLLLIKL